MAFNSSSDPRSSQSRQQPDDVGFVRGALDPSTLPYMPPPRKERSSKRIPVVIGMVALTCIAVPLTPVTLRRSP